MSGNETENTTTSSTEDAPGITEEKENQVRDHYQGLRFRSAADP